MKRYIFPVQEIVLEVDWHQRSILPTAHHLSHECGRHLLTIVAHLYLPVTAIVWILVFNARMTPHGNLVATFAMMLISFSLLSFLYIEFELKVITFHF
jgi:hypothetical protein